MEKTVNIIIGGASFVIEEDAYAELSAYLESLKQHFSAYSEGAEIIGDIESRIAENFGERIKMSKQPAILLSDVKEVKKSMGEVADLAVKNGEKKSEEETSIKQSRLYRNSDDAVIAGVCSGLAAYFGVDPVIMRIIFVLATIFMAGLGIIVYIVLWISMPEARTVTEKIEMRGTPVTIKKIEKAVGEAFKKDKAGRGVIQRLADSLAAIVRALVNGLSAIIKPIANILMIVVGLGIMIGAVIGMVSSGIAIASGVYNIDSPYISDLPMDELSIMPEYYYAVVALFGVIIVPLAFLLILGVSMVRRKNSFSALLSGLLLLIWMVSTIIFGVIGFRLAPVIEKYERDTFGRASFIEVYEEIDTPVVSSTLAIPTSSAVSSPVVPNMPAVQ